MTVPEPQTPTRTTFSRRSWRYSTSVTSSSSVDSPATRRSDVRSSSSSWSPSYDECTVAPACSVVPALASTRATTSSATSCAERVSGVSSVWLVVCCGSVKGFLFSSRCLQGPTRHRRPPRYFAAGRAAGRGYRRRRERARPLLHRTAGLPRRAPAAARAPGRPGGRGRDGRAASSPRTTSTSARGCSSTTSPRRRRTGDLLDLGCGWGPIALTLALESPAARVWAVDVNERALDLTRRNAERLGATNVRAVRPDEVPDDVRFAAIWSNPPIRVGKVALHAMLTQLARPPRARRRGAPGRRQEPRRRLAAAVDRRPSSASPSTAPRAPRGSACSPCTTDERLAGAAHHHLEHGRADLHGRVRVARGDDGDADRLRRARRRVPVRVRVRRAARDRRRRHGRWPVRGATAADRGRPCSWPSGCSPRASSSPAPRRRWGCSSRVACSRASAAAR